MHEKFRDSDKAASYVASGLRNDFPDATAEVIQILKTRPRKTHCEVSEIGPVLQRMCKKFPMASVEYHPENPYGFVAEIRCHGERNAITTFQMHKHKRPRIVVLLTRVGDREILVGSKEAPHDNDAKATQPAAPR